MSWHDLLMACRWRRVYVGRSPPMNATERTLGLRRMGYFPWETSLLVITKRDGVGFHFSDDSGCTNYW